MSNKAKRVLQRILAVDKGHILGIYYERRAKPVYGDGGRFCQIEHVPRRQSPACESRLHAVRSTSEPSLQGAGLFYVE